MKDIINNLLNNQYKVLKIIFDNQISINNETYCPLSQEKMANELGVTRVTVGNIINKLKDDGLIISDGFSKYRLSDDAIKVMKKLKKM